MGCAQMMLGGNMHLPVVGLYVCILIGRQLLKCWQSSPRNSWKEQLHKTVLTSSLSLILDPDLSL